MLSPKPQKLANFTSPLPGTIEISSYFLVKGEDLLIMEDFYQTKVMCNDNEIVAKIVRDKLCPDYEVKHLTLYFPKKLLQSGCGSLE